MNPTRLTVFSRLTDSVGRMLATCKGADTFPTMLARLHDAAREVEVAYRDADDELKAWRAEPCRDCPASTSAGVPCESSAGGVPECPAEAVLRRAS